MASLNPDYFHWERNASAYATADAFEEMWKAKNELDGRSLYSECVANKTKMKYKPIRLTFPHMDRQTSLRKLLWHEDDLISNVSYEAVKNYIRYKFVRCKIFTLKQKNDHINISVKRWF